MALTKAQQAILDQMATARKYTGDLPWELQQYRQKIHAAEEKYQGWANRETWALNLHLSNDEGIYNLIRGMAREAKEAAVPMWAAENKRSPKAWPAERRDADIRYFAADMFKESVTEWMDEEWESFTQEPRSNFILMVRDMHPDYRIDWMATYDAFIEE